MLVLSFLKQRPMYTYEMMQEIEIKSNGVLTFNTMYQAFYRLKEKNCIEEYKKDVSPDNHVRIFFQITDVGRRYQELLLKDYCAVSAAIWHVLKRNGDVE